MKPGELEALLSGLKEATRVNLKEGDVLILEVADPGMVYDLAEAALELFPENRVMVTSSDVKVTVAWAPESERVVDAEVVEETVHTAPGMPGRVIGRRFVPGGLL